MFAVFLFTEGMKGKTLREAIQQRSPLIKDFLPTFCVTASTGFRYRFYLGHDFDDTVFRKEAGRFEFSDMFSSAVKQMCERYFPVELVFVSCSHKGLFKL